VIVLIVACGGDKFPLPEQPDGDGTGAVGDTTYLQLSPVWDANSGYGFSAPKDILVGREPLIYVADTGNDRVVLLDLAGNVLGNSQPVDNPVGLTQDSKLNLLIVSDSNKIYRINMVVNDHDIAAAPVELVFEETDNPDHRYTGIAAVLASVQGQSVIRYYVSASGDQRRDHQVLIFPEAFNVRLPDAVNLEPLGLGIQSASDPSGITTLRDFNIDFIFCMVGQNSFKVQWITSGEFGFTPRLNPADGDFDLFEPGKFSFPEDVTVDEEGSIFVVDADLNFLFKFSVSGEEQQSFGGAGSGEKQFNQPHGVAIFNKTLYVVDTGNNRIVRFRLSTDVAAR
jgi:DNA-binding beta-propeller fold protein YncE